MFACDRYIYPCDYQYKLSRSTYCEYLGRCFWQNQHKELVWSESEQGYFPKGFEPKEEKKCCT